MKNIKTYGGGMNLKKYLENYKKYDYNREETNELFSKFAKEIKRRGYLTRNDIMRIFLWKLDRIIDRDEEKIKDVSERILQSPGKVKENMELLVYSEDKKRGLKGVGIPLASAVLTILFPEKYAIFDWRTRRATEKKKYIGKNIEGYIKYLKRVKEIAKEQSNKTNRKWTPRNVDKALWVFDKEENGARKKS